jgi:hypothetical protein
MKKKGDRHAYRVTTQPTCYNNIQPTGAQHSMRLLGLYVHCTRIFDAYRPPGSYCIVYRANLPRPSLIQ